MVSTATMVKDTDLRGARPELTRTGVEERPGERPEERGAECSAEPLHGSTDQYRGVRPLFSLEELQDEAR